MYQTKDTQAAPSEEETFGEAVVLGASLAGLLAARVLSERFERVRIVERDRLPEAAEDRRGVPQGRHAHALLAGGRHVVERLFPGIVEALISDGARERDVAASGRWYQPGGYRPQFESGVRAISMSRPFFEAHVRERVRALANVEFLEGRSATGLVPAEAGRIGGVEVRRGRGGSPERLRADLVVDAGGRGSHAPAWLADLGYRRPPVEEIKVNLTYTTRLYRKRPEALPGATYCMVQSVPPDGRRSGLLLPLEDERWMVTLTGRGGERAPTDEAGFLGYARSLPAPDLYRAIRDAEPLGEAKVHRFPSNLRRRYERLERPPEGYVVIGDALCSFNPIYGQGMSVAALEAAALDGCLSEGLHGLPRRFYREAAEVIDSPWRLAAGADLAYADVEGERTLLGAAAGRYLGRALRAATRDREVCLTLIKVTNLLEPPAAFFRPAIVRRVLRDALTGRSPRGTETASPAEKEKVPEAV